MMQALLTVLENPAAAFGLVAVVFALLEVLSGSGWLLWPSAAAAVVALVAFETGPAWTFELPGFAILTGAFALAGRRWTRRRNRHPGVRDPNDLKAELEGRVGEVVLAFTNGRGRVFVGGTEWAAEADPQELLPVGAPARIVRLMSSSRLRVTRS